MEKQKIMLFTVGKSSEVFHIADDVIGPTTEGALGGGVVYHVDSLCGKASKHIESSPNKKDMSLKVLLSDMEEYTGSQKLCPGCVLEAYKRGLLDKMVD